MLNEYSEEPSRIELDNVKYLLPVEPSFLPSHFFQSTKALA